MIPIDFQVTCSKVKVKPLFSAQCFVCSISFDSFTWSIPNLVQGLRSISRWGLSDFQVTRSMSKVKPPFRAQCVVHFIYFDPLLSCFGQVLFLQRTWISHHGGFICFWNISCLSKSSTVWKMNCSSLKRFNTWLHYTDKCVVNFTAITVTSR